MTDPAVAAALRALDNVEHALRHGHPDDVAAAQAELVRREHQVCDRFEALARMGLATVDGGVPRAAVPRQGGAS